VGRVIDVAWDTGVVAVLREIRVETTAGGPWFGDYGLVLEADGRRAVRLPEPLVPIVLPSLQLLPNFDNQSLIRAMATTEKVKLSVWSRLRS
jgi:hypothetical protein